MHFSCVLAYNYPYRGVAAHTTNDQKGARRRQYGSQRLPGAALNKARPGVLAQVTLGQRAQPRRYTRRVRSAVLFARSSPVLTTN